MPITIGYWDIRGLAAPCRMICEYGGLEYSVDLYTLKDGSKGAKWFGEDKPKHIKKNPLISLPYLITEDDDVVTQSNACFYYLGRKAGLLGADDKTMTRSDQMICQAYDLRAGAVALLYGGKDDYAAKAKPWLSESLGGGGSKSAKDHIAAISATLKVWGTKYVGGDKPCIADMVLFEMLEMHEAWAKKEGCPSLLDANPEAMALVEGLKADPKLAKYFASEAYTALPYNNIVANFF